jgi:hypothetical protein
MNQEDCVMCGKLINTDIEPYETGESLGEYWCIDCVIAHGPDEEIAWQKRRIQNESKKSG